MVDGLVEPTRSSLPSGTTPNTLYVYTILGTPINSDPGKYTDPVQSLGKFQHKSFPTVNERVT